MYGPVVCDPKSHAFVGVSRLSNAAELAALMFAVREICVAMQLEKEEQGKEVLPVPDASFVSDNMCALGGHAVPDEGCDQPRPGAIGSAMDLGFQGSTLEQVQARACPFGSARQ